MDDLFARMQEAMDRESPRAGVSPEDLIELPDDLRRLVQWVARKGDVAAEDAADALGVGVDEARERAAQAWDVDAS